MKKLVCLLATFCVGCATDAPVIVQGGTTSASGPPTTSAPRLATSIDHDGLYKVGTDISPGSWHTDGGRRRTMYNQDGSPADVDTRCHWAVGPLASRNGRPFILQATAQGEEPGPQDVTISLGDDAFETLGCRDWHLR